MSGNDGFFAGSAAMAAAERAVEVGDDGDEGDAAVEVGAAGAGRGSANLLSMTRGIVGFCGSGWLMKRWPAPPINMLPLWENSRLLKRWPSTKFPCGMSVLMMGARAEWSMEAWW